jgi:ResB-like family
VQPLSRATAPDEQNVVTAAIEIVSVDLASDATQDSLGTWLVSDALSAPQTFSWMNHTWQLVLRPTRYYKPYSITLQKFTHERYAGTEIPRNFASRVTLIDPERSTNRDALIYMNHPLRYRGETFYQAGFQKDDSATVLQVVHNPSVLAPYLACLIVATGLLVQFGYHLFGFARQRRTAMG